MRKGSLVVMNLQGISTQKFCSASKSFVVNFSSLFLFNFTVMIHHCRSAIFSNSMQEFSAKKL